MTGTPNLLLITLDGLRHDIAYGGKLPTLNRLRERGTTFRRAVASAPLTPISHASVFTALQPPRHGIRHLFLEQLDEGIATFPQALRDHGYETSAIVSCPGLSTWYGLDRGFGHYDDEIPRAPDGSDALELVDAKERGRAAKRASQVVERGLDQLDALTRRRDRPFFLFLHFFDAHWPYEPPEPFGDFNPRSPYEGEAAYMDSQLGEFLDALDHRGLWDDLMVVVMADHGEDLAGIYPNDHGGELGDHPEEEGHGCLLYDTTQLVPLVMVPPAARGGLREVAEQVRLIDIGPTLLDVAGVPPMTPTDGVSLRPHLRGEGNHLPGYCETHYPRENEENLRRFPDLSNLKAVRLSSDDSEMKVIWHLQSDRVEIYDLRADPHEKDDLGLAALPEVLADPRVRVRQAG